MSKLKQITHPKILIVAGEASGDMHGAKLVREILALNPNIYFFGMGGQQMAQAGVNLIVDAAELAIVGFTEIITKIKPLFRAFRKLRQAILDQSPDIIILIDYPGFNLRLAKFARQQKSKIIYYISPQIWAWRRNRIKIIKKNIDLMAVIFPFEVDFYQSAEVPVKYVGHPLAHHVKTSMSISNAKQFFRISEEKLVIGLMPGSRQSEIKSILPVLLTCANQLKSRYSQIEFLLPLASTLSEQQLLPFIKKTNLKINLIKTHHYDAMKCCDLIIAASGTTTLEVALLGVPLIVAYKSSMLSFVIAKCLVRIPYISLCNIVADKRIVAEYIQYEATAEKIISEAIKLIEDNHYRNEMLNGFENIKNKLHDNTYTVDLARYIIGYCSAQILEVG